MNDTENRKKYLNKLRKKLSGARIYWKSKKKFPPCRICGFIYRSRPHLDKKRSCMWCGDIGNKEK